MSSRRELTREKRGKQLQILFALLLFISFFLPWVSWAGSTIAGYDMPAGNFFSISEKKFSLGNPFPQFNFAVIIFWLIPLFTVAVLLLSVVNKKNTVLAVISGMLALSLTTVYILFTDTLLQLGVGSGLFHELQLALYITIVSSIGIIFVSLKKILLLKKLSLVITGPAVAWGSFLLISNFLENEKFGTLARVKAAYTVNALDFISEFRQNDSIANKKYSEKIITVNGNVSEIISTDSTVNLKFIENNTGSYIIFTFPEKQIALLKSIKPGDRVSIKGSCSGGVYSEILGKEFITFKRSEINSN